MLPDDLPTSVTDKIYRAPFPDRLSQNDVKALLVHFWPAIEQHVRAQIADQVAELPTANDGQLIHATREQILNTIRSAAN